eukprot:scaffold88036_cov26-Tisochrysis_lutea.AAC.1
MQQWTQMLTLYLNNAAMASDMMLPKLFQGKTLLTGFVDTCCEAHEASPRQKRVISVCTTCKVE